MPDVPKLRRDVGQALVEYALVLALITLVSISVMRSVGADVSGIFGQASSALNPGAGGGGGNGNGHGPGGNGNGNNGNGNGNGGPSGNNPGNGNAGGGGGRP